MNRVDELEEIYGITIPAIFGLNEEENAGITFDWNYVRAWGFFYGDSYSDDEPIYYTGGADSYIDDVYSRLEQAYEDFVHGVTNLYQANPESAPSTVPHHARLKIEDIHYLKQLVVTSHDEPGDNPHFRVKQDANETDYNNAKVTARSLAAKGAVFRPVKHFVSELDVRLRKGMRFQTVDGKEWVAISVRQTVNDDGTKMEVSAQPRLVL